MTELHSADYAVLVVYLLVVVGVCIRVSKAAPSADELFLAGRSLGFGVVGLSLFASNISSTTLIGLPGAAWHSGIAVANYEWMAALILLVSTFTVVPVFLGRRITTVPELLEQRYDGRMRRYLSGVTVFLSVMLDTAGSMYAGAVVMMQFIPGLSLVPTCIGLAVFTGLYTAAGGLRAVAYTDALQTGVLLVGSAILAWIVFGEFDHSWDNMVAAVGDEHLSLIRPLDDPELPWLGTLIGLPILGFYYWTMNQYVSQRLLGARDMQAAGWGAVVAATLKLLPLFFMVLPGAMAAVLLPDLERADAVFPQLIVEYAPVGLAGLILAGLLAAIMSSVDSALNSASTLITLDFIHRDPVEQSEARQLARTGRWVTAALVVVAAVWAPMIDRFPGLFAYLQQGFTYVATPLVAPFILAFVSRRVGPKGALYGTLSGHVFSALWFAASLAGLIELHFSIAAGIVLVVTWGACLLWSRLCSEPEQTPLRSPRARIPASVGWGSLFSAALMVWLVASFW